ncbi:hypothetical protein MA16_Dca027994 [Dendrobium catenatum]|uniref:Uncharacterized protein n=1 Tax=Dendrobium catenatum TaxID=906689 RepID=A0A2I0VG71_9ASPA|nr:hypothetical protein MA16_Dca027994 [Dendrobium catenatum]
MSALLACMTMSGHKQCLWSIQMVAQTGDSDVHNSSQDSMLADNNTKNFEDNESIFDINVLSSAYPIEGNNMF